MSTARKYTVSAEQILEPAPVSASRIKDQLGLTVDEFGAAVGRSPRSAARWVANEGSMPATGAAAREVRRLAYLQSLLDDVLGAERGREWLRRPNQGFRGEAPIDLITAGRADQVVDVLELLADGGPV